MTLHATKVFDIYVAVGLRIHALNTTLHRPRKLHIKTGENFCYDCIDIFSRRGRPNSKIIERLSGVEKLEKEWSFVDEVRGILKIRSPTKLFGSRMQ